MSEREVRACMLGHSQRGFFMFVEKSGKFYSQETHFISSNFHHHFHLYYTMLAYLMPIKLVRNLDQTKTDSHVCIALMRSFAAKIINLLFIGCIVYEVCLVYFIVR